MNNTINTNANKVEYYEFNSSAHSVLNAAVEMLNTPLPTVERINKVIGMLVAARVLLISYDIEKANYESEKRAKQAADQQAAAKQLEQFSEEVFGA